MSGSRGHGFARFVRVLIDILNILLGLAIVAMAILAFAMGRKYQWMFPMVFLLGAGANVLTGIKCLMTERRIPGCIMFVVAGLLVGIAYVANACVGGIL